MEYNLVEVWLRRDPVRWAAGILGSLFATLLAIGTAMLVADLAHFEIFFPIKLMATTMLGPSATELGINSQSILTGTLVLTFICLFWGFLYAHFTGTNSLKALLAMGLVWGIFSWIFLWNLFLQSFKPIYAAHIPAALVFPICIAYGLGLASIGFFDSILRKNKKN